MPDHNPAKIDDCVSPPHQEIIQACFLKFFPFALELSKSFVKLCDIKAFPKNAVLKHPNEREAHISVVLNGSIGSFVTQLKGEICLDLSLGGDFSADFESLLTGKPSQAYTKTLEPTLLARLPLASGEHQAPKDLDHLLKSGAEFMFIDRQNRLIGLLSQSPLERYRQLQKRNPRWVQSVSATVLASWLGITREHLSRIRAKAP